MSKFTKIKKWVVENGFQIKNAYMNNITVRVSDETHFNISYRESSLFTSRSGSSGGRAGLYMSIHQKGKRNMGSCFYYSQKEIIEYMEDFLGISKEMIDFGYDIDYN